MSLYLPAVNVTELASKLATKVDAKELNSHIATLRNMRKAGASNAACYRKCGLEWKYTTGDTTRICAMVFGKGIHYQAVRQCLLMGPTKTAQKADALAAANARIRELERKLAGK